MSWQPEVDEIHRRREFALAQGGAESIARHHAKGELTVRERVDVLCDSGTFREHGRMAGSAFLDDEGRVESFSPANYVVGVGELDGRQVAIGGEDFTLRGGSPNASGLRKSIYAEHLALRLRIPLVRLLEGGGGSVESPRPGSPKAEDGGGAGLRAASLSGHCRCDGAGAGGLGGTRRSGGFSRRAPRRLAFLGDCPRHLSSHGGRTGIGRARAGAHDEQRRAGGRRGARAQWRGRQHRVRRARRPSPDPLLPELPSAQRLGARTPHRLRRPAGFVAKRACSRLCPANRRRPFDVLRLIDLVVDRGSFFPIAPDYGPSIAVGLARVNGQSVGVTANDCRHLAGAMTAQAAQKMRRLIELCDTFHLPVLNFVDEPGFMIGPDAERDGTIRYGMAAVAAAAQARTPWASVQIHKAFGVAAAAHFGPDTYRLDWPSAESGALPIEGGVAVAYRRRIAQAEDPAAMRRELETQLARTRSPYPAAESFAVHDIIDPRETRPALCEWVEWIQTCSWRPSRDLFALPCVLERRNPSMIYELRTYSVGRRPNRRGGQELGRGRPPDSR